MSPGITNGPWSCLLTQRLFCSVTLPSFWPKVGEGCGENHHSNYTLPSSCSPSSRTAPSEAPPCSHLFTSELSPGSVSPLKQKPRGAPSLHKYVEISELAYCSSQQQLWDTGSGLLWGNWEDSQGDLVWRKPFRNKRFLPWQSEVRERSSPVQSQPCLLLCKCAMTSTVRRRFLKCQSPT